MEAAFKALASARGDNVGAREALEIARRYPRPAAHSGAIATYVIGFQVKPEQRITIKDPMKSGLALIFSKPVHFDNCGHLTAGYELALTQTAYDAEAGLVAMVPFLNASLQDHFDRGLTRQDFTAISQVAAWSAKKVGEYLIKDIGVLKR